MSASSFGPRTIKECNAWARTFALEAQLVENAVNGYIAILEGSTGAAPSDGEVAKTLAQLRKDVGRIMGDDAHAPERARDLDLMGERLDRAIGHAEVLAAAGLDTVPDLRARLNAARALVSAVRAALARRAKPRGA